MDSAFRRAIDPSWYDFDSFDRPTSRLVNQYFGAGLDDGEFFVPSSRMYPRSFRSRLLRPSSGTNDKDGGVAEKKVEKDIFSVKLDVHQFTPEEILVKTKENNLIIEASHEEKEDPHGFISRQFTRRYILPEDVKADQLICNLSSDGVLAIEAPRSTSQHRGENLIPINQTGRPAVVTSPTPTTAPPTTDSKNKERNSGHTQNIHIQQEVPSAAASDNK